GPQWVRSHVILILIPNSGSVVDGSRFETERAQDPHWDAVDAVDVYRLADTDLFKNLLWGTPKDRITSTPHLTQTSNQPKNYRQRRRDSNFAPHHKFAD